MRRLSAWALCASVVAGCYQSHSPGDLGDGGGPSGDGASTEACPASGRHVRVTVTAISPSDAALCASTGHLASVAFGAIGPDGASDGLRFTSDRCVYVVGGIGTDMPDHLRVAATQGVLDWTPTSFAVVTRHCDTCASTQGLVIVDGDPASLVPSTAPLTITPGMRACTSDDTCATASFSTTAVFDGFPPADAHAGEARQAPGYSFWLRSLHDFRETCTTRTAGFVAWWDWGYI